jgi:hypothetical protein
MKRCLVLVALIVCSTLSMARPVQAQSYPFTCNIGANTMRSLNINFLPATGIAFTRSAGPAAAGLTPGECAFADRAVRASEPTFLCFQATINTLVHQNGTTLIEFGGPGAAVAQAAFS